MTAITGTLTINVGDDTVLTDTTDLGLAWQWAEHEVNANPDMPAWDGLTYAEKCQQVADALHALRVAYGPVADDDIDDDDTEGK